jgi:hypothetical protein
VSSPGYDLKGGEAGRRQIGDLAGENDGVRRPLTLEAEQEVLERR